LLKSAVGILWGVDSSATKNWLNGSRLRDFLQRLSERSQRDQIDPIFLATVQATEEAVINAMVAAETMTGANNRTVIALPHEAPRSAEEIQRPEVTARIIDCVARAPRPRLLKF